MRTKGNAPILGHFRVQMTRRPVVTAVDRTNVQIASREFLILIFIGFKLNKNSKINANCANID